MHRFSGAFDLHELNGWLRMHGKNDLQGHDLPAHGYLVPGVAAGFLFLADGGLGILEGFVTNPRATRSDRNDALDGIVVALLDDAKAKHCRRVLAISRDSGIALRARRHGFSSLGSHEVFERIL